MIAVAAVVIGLAISSGCVAKPGGHSQPEAAAAAPPPARVTERDRAIVRRLVAFARQPSRATWARVPFAPRVRLGLARQLLRTAEPTDLRDPAAWSFNPTSFRAYVGPFSALDLLARNRSLRIGVGPHRRCVSPPLPPPQPVAGLRHVSVQPHRIDSCLQWFSVDMFVTRSGKVAAVTLDLYEP